MTRRPRVAENAVLLLLVATAFVFAVSRPEPLDPAAVDVGALEDFPLGEPVFREIRVRFIDPVSPRLPYHLEPGADQKDLALLWIVRRRDGPLALYARDPHCGCRVQHISGARDPSVFHQHAARLHHDVAPEDIEFVTPCHLEMYSLTGERVTGPQERGLDRFETRIDPNGRVLVDLTRFERGRRAT